MELPDIDDMLDAGMTLPQAFAFWGYMMSNQHLPPAHWWSQLKPRLSS